MGPHHCRDRGLQAADFVHTALGLEIPGGFHFKAFIVSGTDEGAAPEGMLEAQAEPGERADGEVTFGDGLPPGCSHHCISSSIHGTFKCDFCEF